MAPRSSFATEFLLRELLSALGAPLTADSVPVDSFSESLSEDTEPQSAASSVQSRVMLVRRTNSSQQTATLVDREYDVEAFIPSHVSAALQKERGYRTIGRLRGSVVRVTKYHFATMTRCLSADQQNRETSVSAPNVGKEKARVYLWVDALAIVEDNELAVQPLPEVYSHPLVEERLQALSDAELEKQLMINQGLPPLGAAVSDRFDDDRPLLEEDCVIPEDQEQELEEQDEWGPPTTIERQPTDSELIEENGSVPMPGSQVVRGAVSTQDSMASSGNLSVTLSGNPSVSLSGESSLDSQRFQFQQEDIRETFVAGSDVESSDTEDQDDELEETKKSTTSTPKSGHKAWSSRKYSSVDSSPAPTQNSWNIEEKDDAVDPRASSHTSSKTQQSAENEKPAKNWIIEKLTSMLGLPSAEDSGANLSDEEEDDSAEDDERATQILDQQDKVKEEEENEATENKFVPEEFMSSQATVVLHYAMDNDEDANAFEYEGITSPRSMIHELDDDTIDKEQAESADSADDLTLTEESAEVAVTPQKKAGSKEDNVDFKTPSPSAHASTPGTEKRAGETPSVSTSSPATLQTPAASPPSSKDPVSPTEPSGHLPPVKSPSKLVISVSSSFNRPSRTGFSSGGSKRRHQQTNAEDTSPATTSGQDSASEPNAHTDAQSRGKQKRRRRDILLTQEVHEAASQSPQFEHPAAPLLSRRRPQSDRGTLITDSYSLDAVCRSLGSNARDQRNQEGQTRSSRQPRHAWKRYESLFPPLNMTRLKQMMTEGKHNQVGR
ncbi:hypothetical protein PC116_g23327 [Phytophthora cactorum]|uniref:Telomere replication protein EST3 n=1 Tax=Phytophthora cactorum TaxID=29920 RepID=A0A329RLB6_9STRA|nr:hypothetical protein PC112_g19466 [Phytophthora cactorum]KAG2803511.1 hypothetical protein PC111_g18650 [Phytophthora cactorum]KAG2840068.1 hypothetical protein PC113_g19340 [Phytophthora cactorum]KAG2966724.1 hypothetical protein PC118_g19001 [Phytophthora cactorum]KAG3136217.1 hypothetical protein C6341_g21477 [Phytophthora cactorum]